MKILFIVLIYIFITTQICHSQQAQLRCEVVVSNEQGRILKAQNNGNQSITFCISYVTEGKNQNGAVVSSVKEHSGYIELRANEIRQILTAPKDPQNKITYTFRNVVITECTTTKPPINSRGINTRMNGGS